MISSEVSFLEFGKDVGGLVRRHLLDDIAGLLRLEASRMLACILGIDFRERVGGRFAVDGFEDGLAFGGAQFFDDIRQVGRGASAPASRRRCFSRSRRSGSVSHVAEVPQDELGGMGALQPAESSGGENQTLAEPAENAAEADVHFQNRERVAGAVRGGFHG